MLTPTKKQLTKIGFKRELIFSRVVYRLNGKCNDSIYYNYSLESTMYKWYYQTNIGEATNSVHLSMDSFPELYAILRAFRFEYEFSVI